MDKRTTLTLWVAMLSCAVTPALAGDLWETDFDKAADIAKASNRYMLLDFSGSDWCGWCIKLDEEVFSRKDFKNYAKQHLVCVLLDFPRHKSIKKSLKEQNQQLATKYKVNGFPSVIILSPAGDMVARTGYLKGGAKKYVKHLGEFIDPHRQKHHVPDPTPIQESQPAEHGRLSLQANRPQPLAKDDNRELRAWTSKSGASVTASVLQEKGPYVILKKEDGTTVQILASKLSDEDRKYIAELKQKDTAQPSPSDL